MKKFFQIILYILCAVWSVSVVMKIVMAFSGTVTINGDGPGMMAFGAIFNGLLALGAYKWAKHLGKPKVEPTQE